MMFNRRFVKACEGAAAVEFSLLLMPFLIFIFGILDVALMFFVDGALDSSLHHAAREVRTGQAANQNWDITDFKAEVCDNMTFAFGCSDSLLVVTQTMNNFSDAAFTNPVKNGAIEIEESFATGDPGDYVLIQAFLPWQSWLAPLGLNTAHLSDGRYVLSASALFRNEPYEQ